MCNAVGQTAGYFLGNVVFLALESPGFCNRYIRWTQPKPYGVLTLAGGNFRLIILKHYYFLI